MGKTLWGIDLDESPAGGLIERLLSEEELEALTDGGRADGGGDDDEDRPDETDGTESYGEAEESGFEFDAETETGDDVEVGGDDDGEVEVDIGHRGASMFDPDVESDDDDGGLRDRFPSLGGDGDATGDEDEADEDHAGADGSGGLVARVRPHLLKIAVAGVVLAVVAVLAWRYLGTIKSAAGDKLGRGDGDESGDERDDVTEVDVDVNIDDDVDVDDDAPPARRRAKGLADAEPLGEAESDGDGGAPAADADHAAVGGSESADENEDDGVAVPGGAGDSDAGALLGLAFLALVAALVRKFSDEREYDPLVDGPE